MMAMRPARLSAIADSNSGELDPVMTKRPAASRRLSIATRKAGNKAGNNWLSSIATRSAFSRRNKSGSRAIAS